MNYWKRVVVLSLLLLGFVGASFAATNPEWRPFKLNLGPYAQSGTAGPALFSKMEVTIFGGFMSGFGLLAANNVATDLLTGKSSPWYGAGYTAFSWPLAGPATLSADMTAPMLTKDGGALAGIKLGFNITQTFQLELYFAYGFSGYSIDPTIWTHFTDSKAKTTTSLQSIGRTVTFMDNSLQKAGKTILAGVNFNITLETTSTIMPYFSLGAGMMSVSDTPLISWSMNQVYSPTSNATYGMDITYASKIAILLSGALGLKYYIGPTYGIKFEARGNMAMASLDKMVATTFKASDAGWTVYTPYNKLALTEKGSPIFVTGILGFFFGF